MVWRSTSRRSEASKAIGQVPRQVISGIVGSKYMYFRGALIDFCSDKARFARHTITFIDPLMHIFDIFRACLRFAKANNTVISCSLRSHVARLYAVMEVFPSYICLLITGTNAAHCGFIPWCAKQHRTRVLTHSVRLTQEASCCSRKQLGRYCSLRSHVDLLAFVVQLRWRYLIWKHQF